MVIFLKSQLCRLSLLHKDQKGIIAKISNILFENEVNILDISQTIMQDMFTMIMLVNFENESVTVKQISEKFEQAEKDMGLSIHVQREEIFTSMHRI